MELRKMGAQFCNQTAIDDKSVRVSNKILANFVAKEYVRIRIIKR